MDGQPERRTTDSGLSAGANGVLTAREAARNLGVNERTIRRAIARGELVAVKRQGVYRITPPALGYATPASIPLLTESVLG